MQNFWMRCLIWCKWMQETLKPEKSSQNLHMLKLFDSYGVVYNSYWVNHLHLFEVAFTLYIWIWFELILFLLFLSLSGLLYTLFRYAYSEIEKGILNEYGLVIDSTAILSQINLQPITLICVTCIGILVILVIDIATFTKRINKEIRDSLKERKLENNFSNFIFYLTFFF